MTQELKLQMNDDLPLREVVFDTLRQAILDGTLQPGERLMEIHLARQLGVSRTPVREALRKLEQEGLVLTRPGRGAAVAQIMQSDLEDVLEVREALEELAVRRACARISEEQFARLCGIADDFAVSLRAGDLAGAAGDDEAFHAVLCEAAGNRRLSQLMDSLRSRMYRYRLESLKNKKNHPDLIRQHTLICEAVKAKDEEMAASAIRMHITKQKLSAAENLSGGPSQPLDISASTKMS